MTARSGAPPGRRSPATGEQPGVSVDQTTDPATLAPKWPYVATDAQVAGLEAAHARQVGWAEGMAVSDSIWSAAADDRERWAYQRGYRDGQAVAEAIETERWANLKRHVQGLPKGPSWEELQRRRNHADPDRCPRCGVRVAAAPEDGGGS